MHWFGDDEGVDIPQPAQDQVLITEVFSMKGCIGDGADVLILCAKGQLNHGPDMDVFYYVAMPRREVERLAGALVRLARNDDYWQDLRRKYNDAQGIGEHGIGEQGGPCD